MKPDYESPLEHSSSPDGCREDCPACEDERSDSAYWKRMAQKAISEGKDVPANWVTEWDNGADGCMPEGWYLQGRDSNGFSIDWPIRHEYGPFTSVSEAESHAEKINAAYAHAKAKGAA